MSKVDLFKDSNTLQEDAVLIQVTTGRGDMIETNGLSEEVFQIKSIK